MKKNINLLRAIFFFKSLWFFAPILTLFYMSRGLNMFQIISLETILMITILFMEIPTGYLADKIGRKNSMFFVTGLYIIGNVITIYAHDFWVFGLVGILFGIAISFGSGAIEALVYDSLLIQKKESDMTKVWGNIQSFSLIGGIIAITIGGFIASNPDNYVLTLWLYNIGALIAFVLTFFINDNNKYDHKNNKIDFSLLSKNKELIFLIFLSIITYPFYHVLKFMIQDHFVDLAIPVNYFGLIIGFAWLLQALLSHYAFKLKEWFGKKSLFITTIIPGLMYVSLAIFFNEWIAIISYWLCNSFIYARDPLFSEYINEHLPSKNRATMLSVISMISSGYVALMRLLIGKITNVNNSYAFLFMGCLIIIGSFFALRK